MNNKIIKGIVEEVNQNWKSVKINGENFSGKFTYKGEMPSKGDEIEMEVISSVSKKDGKTYWNITEIKTIKKSNSIEEARQSKTIEMLTSYGKDIFIEAYKLNFDKKEFNPEETAKLCAKIVNTIREEVINPSIEETKDNTI